MIGTPSRKASKATIEQKKREIHELCQIPCFELGVPEEMQALWRAILYHFTAGAEG